MKTEFVATRPAIALVAALSLGSMVSCSKPVRTECEKGALVDTAGESGEKARVDFQWMAIKYGIDSAMRTSAGFAAHRMAEGTLDGAISRYRDSMKADGTGLVSKSGCIDWISTWYSGRFDHAAMTSAWLRSLKTDSVSAVEWGAVSDSGSPQLRIRVVYSLPGADGGGIDSAILRLDSGMVSIAIN